MLVLANLVVLSKLDASISKIAELSDQIRTRNEVEDRYRKNEEDDRGDRKLRRSSRSE